MLMTGLLGQPWKRGLAVVLSLVAVVGGIIVAATGSAAAGTAACGAHGTLSNSGLTYSCTYTTVGADTFVPPTGITTVNITVDGAPGGNGGTIGTNVGEGFGGAGASVTAKGVSVAGLSSLAVSVGGAGSGGGETDDPNGGAGGEYGGGTGGGGTTPNTPGYGGGGGGGGGMSAVKSGSTNLIIAGGGGGGGGEFVRGGPVTGGEGGPAGDKSVTGGGAGAGDPGCTNYEEGTAEPTAGSGGLGAGAGGAGSGDSACGESSGHAADGSTGGAGATVSGSVGGGGGGGGGGGYAGGGGGVSVVGGGGGGGSSSVESGLQYSISTASSAEVEISWTAAAPTVSIVTPAANATYTVGQSVTSSFSCAEGAGGPGLMSCENENGAVSGAAINTANAGTYSFTVTAKSTDGLTTTVTHDYTVAAASSSGGGSGGSGSGGSGSGGSGGAGSGTGSSGGSGSAGGSGAGSGSGSGMTAPSTTTISGRAAGFTFTLAVPDTCTARGAKLVTELTSPVAGKGYRVVGVYYYIDQGKKRKRGSIYLVPNLVTRVLRAENLSLAGLKAGKHKLRVLVDLRSTRRKGGRYRFKTVLLTSHFTVCA